MILSLTTLLSVAEELNFVRLHVALNTKRDGAGGMMHSLTLERQKASAKRRNGMKKKGSGKPEVKLRFYGKPGRGRVGMRADCANPPRLPAKRYRHDP